MRYEIEADLTEYVESLPRHVKRRMAFAAMD
jgi:hypothetical protein